MNKFLEEFSNSPYTLFGKKVGDNTFRTRDFIHVLSPDIIIDSDDIYWRDNDNKSVIIESDCDKIYKFMSDQNNKHILITNIGMLTAPNQSSRPQTIHGFCHGCEKLTRSNNLKLTFMTNTYPSLQQSGNSLQAGGNTSLYLASMIGIIEKGIMTMTKNRCGGNYNLDITTIKMKFREEKIKTILEN